ncbi:MAG: hypothetical protein HRT89_02555 [Lentisphaeria bacterium]|nr:hypothetical protein [Lentisphaeria bacterium]NQZ66929.1 hypothetical protein [Lentisphaeria bacterium]
MNTKKIVRKIRDPFIYAFVRVFVFILQCLPLFLVRAIGSLTSFLHYHAPGQAKIAIANIKIAFPDWEEAQVKSCCKASFTNFHLTFFEFFWYQKHKGQLKDLVHDMDEIEQHLGKKTGYDSAIMICPHLGNWELANLIINYHGYKMSPVARKLKNPYLETLVCAYRQSTGAGIIHEKGAAKNIVRVLRSNEVLGMLIDQNVKEREGGVFMNFFGLPVPTSRAPASLAMKINSAVVFCYCIHDENGNRRLHFTALKKAISDYEDDLVLLQDILDEVQRIVRQYPEQYLWLYERYRYHDKNFADLSKYPFYSFAHEG